MNSTSAADTITHATLPSMELPFWPRTADVVGANLSQQCFGRCVLRRNQSVNCDARLRRCASTVSSSSASSRRALVRSTRVADVLARSIAGASTGRRVVRRCRVRRARRRPLRQPCARASASATRPPQTCSTRSRRSTGRDRCLRRPRCHRGSASATSPRHVRVATASIGSATCTPTIWSTCRLALHRARDRRGRRR